METPCKTRQAPKGCRVRCATCGRDVCFGEKYVAYDTGVPSGIAGFNITQNYCMSCLGPCERSRAVCYESNGGYSERTRSCDKCHRLILRHMPRIMWLPNADLMEYPNPPWSYRHVTCGSPCEMKVAA